MTDLAFVSAVELARSIRDREISPVEIVELYLDRIARVDPVLGAFVTIDGERALESAREAERRSLTDEHLPPLLGIPVGVKDVVETAGVRTTYSSAVFADHVATTDDATWRRMKDAGCILLGKTNTPEFAGADATTSRLNGGCRNPWDPTLVTGGSSGGSAAAVAAGLCAIADGTDGGGSIRTPASCCGVVGVKPSRGRVSLGPRFGQQMNGMVTAGPIGRTVLDAAALLDVMEGYETGDPYWLPSPPRSFVEEAQVPTGPLRIAVATSSPGDRTRVDRACSDAALAAARLLEDMGHHVEEATPAWDDEEAWAAIGVAYTSWLSYFAPLDPRRLDPINRHELALASGITMTDYIQATVTLDAFARSLVGFFDDYEALVTPSLGLIPVPLDWFDWNDPEEILERGPEFVPTSPVWNVTGQPAASIPLSWTPEGIPIGVQLTTRPGRDDTLLKLCRQLEMAASWHGRRPPEEGLSGS